MNLRPIFLSLPFWMMGWALLLPAASAQAAPIRVTTWNLQPGAVAGTNGWSTNFQQSLVLKAAESLKPLHPDVILLQQVADWKTCHQLVQALQPDTYHIVICSSFREPGTNLLSRQVAILSKARGYLAWSEQWQTNGASSTAPGGFAFAAIRLANKNIGVFSVQFSDRASSGIDASNGVAWRQPREASTRELVRQIASLQDWRDNRVQAFIVGGDLNVTPGDSRSAQEKTLSLLEQAGFDDAFATLPLEERMRLRGDDQHPAATQDYIFTRDAGRVDAPLLTQSALCEHDALTCVMDLSAPKATPPPPPMPARAELPPVAPSAILTNHSPAPAALANATVRASGPHTLVFIVGFLAGGLAIFLLARMFARRSLRAPVPAASSELKAITGAGIAISHAEQIIVAPPPESPPYVHIEMEGSMQTQSQTWPPRLAGGRVPGRMNEAARAGVVANLTRWLKQKAVQRLISDREQLLATQQAAGLKVLAVDQRLAKIEQQIHQINQAYEERIDDLLKELIAAKEENRELIRAKITLVKAEMEKARLKAGRHASEHQQY